MSTTPLNDTILRQLQQIAEAQNLSIEQLLVDMLSVYDSTSSENYEDADALQMFKGLFEQNNDAICLISLDDYRITSVNRKAVAMMHLEEATPLLGTSAIGDHMPASERTSALERVKIVKAGNELEPYERIFQRPDGTTFVGEVTLSLIYDKNKNPLYYQSIIRDITPRKRLQESLEAALIKERELNDLRTRILMDVSHEFRTPLTIIQTSSELLQRHFDRFDEAQREKHLKRIRKHVQQLNQMLEAMLVVNKFQVDIASSDWKVEEVNSIFREVINRAKRKDDNQHPVYFFPQLERYEARFDKTVLMVILRELLDNALKYSPIDSPIEIHVSYTLTQLTFEVRDKGRGIPEVDLKHVWDYFYRGENTVSIPGTGLGLTIARLAADTHSASLKIKSTEGKGTSVFVTLPIAPV